jgi:hypothetical protein
LFGTLLGGSDYPQPAVIYAADPNASTSEEPSQRPFETVAPLADRLGLKPDITYAVTQEPQLAAKIVGLAGGVVLVCWKHKAIVRNLLPKIAREQIIPGMPAKWNGDRFDR